MRACPAAMVMRCPSAGRFRITRSADRLVQLVHQAAADAAASHSPALAQTLVAAMTDVADLAANLPPKARAKQMQVGCAASPTAFHQATKASVARCTHAACHSSRSSMVSRYSSRCVRPYLSSTGCVPFKPSAPNCGLARDCCAALCSCHSRRRCTTTTASTSATRCSACPTPMRHSWRSWRHLRLLSWWTQRGVSKRPALKSCRPRYAISSYKGILPPPSMKAWLYRLSARAEGLCCPHTPWIAPSAPFSQLKELVS